MFRRLSSRATIRRRLSARDKQEGPTSLVLNADSPPTELALETNPDTVEIKLQKDPWSTVVTTDTSGDTAGTVDPVSTKGKEQVVSDGPMTSASEPESSPEKEEQVIALKQSELPSNEPLLHYHEKTIYATSTGYWCNVTPAQDKAMQQLKEKVIEAGLDISEAARHDFYADMFFLRFLRARQFKVDQAFALLQADVQWREEVQLSTLRQLSVDEVLGCPVQEVQQYFPQFQFGIDIYGRPVFYKQYFPMDPDKLFQMAPPAKLAKYHIWLNDQGLEMLLQQTKATGHLVDTFVVVIDVSGMVLRQVTKGFLKLVKELSDIDQNHNPERLGTLFIVNPPSIFPMVWRMVSPWLDERTTNKIRMVKTPFKPNSDFFSLIPMDQVPSDYGGTAASCKEVMQLGC